jgi:ubiquinone/menaquinone biosynthesis C-methylase UbiE
LPQSSELINEGGDIKPWIRIVRVLEKLTSVYDLANLIMSLGTLSYVRKEFSYVAESTFKGKRGVILDAGCGPGTSSEILLHVSGPEEYIIGMDPIIAMLSEAARRLKNENKFELVRGVFEALPFREGSLVGATFSFSFRDAINYYKATLELKKALRAKGFAIIMDLGRPRRRIYSKILEGPYISIFPMLAGALLMGWEGIKRYSELRRTYLRFLETTKLYILFAKNFQKARCYYMLGGAIFILTAEKS